MTNNTEAQAAEWLAHVHTYPQHRGAFVNWLDEERAAGRMDWPAVRRWQNAAMPPCRICGGGTSGADVCADCCSYAVTGQPLPAEERRWTPQRGSR